LLRAVSCINILRKVLSGAKSDDASKLSDEDSGALDTLERPFGRLGRYEISREVGRGSYGVVYLAYDPNLRRDVAIKVPRGEAVLTAAMRDRFLREARAAALLSHPNVVVIHEAGQVGPVCYIAAEYCNGLSLAAWLKSQEQPPPVQESAGLLATLA